MLAVLAAVGMVATAVALRQALDDDDGGGGRNGPQGDARVVVVCDEDLREACEALGSAVEVRLEDSATTSATLAAGEVGDVDAWVTSGAWLEVTTSRADGDVGEAAVLATSTVVVAADVERAGAVTALCDGRALWRCLGDEAEQPWSTLGGDERWGPLRTGLPDADTATGLSVLASVAAGFFGGPDFAANDFDDLRGWLGRLTDASGGGDRDLLRTLVRVRGTYSAGGLLAADAEGRPELTALAADPSVTSAAVVVDLPGGDRLPALDPVREALVSGGWDAGDGEPSPVLKPGVMAALHTTWKDITS